MTKTWVTPCSSHTFLSALFTQLYMEKVSRQHARTRTTNLQDNIWRIMIFEDSCIMVYTFCKNSRWPEHGTWRVVLQTTTEKMNLFNELMYICKVRVCDYPKCCVSDMWLVKRFNVPHWQLAWAPEITSLHLSSQNNTATDELECPEPGATFVPSRKQNLLGCYFLWMKNATSILQIRLQVVLVRTLQPFLEPSDK